MATDQSLNHKIWALAWPAILSNLSVAMLGLVDTAILGHLSDARYLGAVAIGGAILSFLYWGFSFLRMGTTGLVATATGAQNEEGARLALARSAVLALAIAALVMLSRPLWLAVGLPLMAPQADIAPWAESYVSIRAWSAPAVLLNYTVVGWFIGRQNTRWPMVFVVVTNLANIALDVLFVIGFGMLSDGAALATVCAEYLGCALALYALRRNLGGWPGRALWQRLWDASAFRRLLRSNRDLFVRTCSLLFAFAFFTANSDNFGGATLAANTIIIQLLLLAAYAMDGFAYAAEALAGNRFGARDLSGMRQTVNGCARWCAGAAVIMSVAFALGQPVFFSLLTDLPEVREILSQYAPWLVLIPLLAAPSYLLDGVFIGTARTGPMMWTMLLSLLLVYLPLWYLTRGWGNHGLWLAFALFNASRGLSLFWVYTRNFRLNRWLTPDDAPASG